MFKRSGKSSSHRTEENTGFIQRLFNILYTYPGSGESRSLLSDGSRRNKWKLKKNKNRLTWLTNGEDKRKKVNHRQISDTPKNANENSGPQLPQTDDCVLQKTLDDVLDSILQTTLDEETSKSEELKYVLEILRSNKELLLQVLQDPKIVNLILINHGVDDSHQNKNGIEIFEKALAMDSKASRDSNASQSSSSSAYSSSSLYSSSNRDTKWVIVRSVVRDIKRRMRQTFGVCRKQRILDDDVSEMSDYLMEGDDMMSPSINLLESRRSKDLMCEPQKLGLSLLKDVSTGETSNPKDFDITIDQEDDKSAEEPVNATAKGGNESNDGSSPCSSTLNTSKEQPVIIPKQPERPNPGYARLPSLRKLRSCPELQDESYIIPKTSLDLCAGDDEFKFEYLKALLEASGLCDIDAKYTDSNSTRVFDLNLYDEIETPSGEIPDDLRNLFDCIAEVVENIHERSSNHIPWTCFVDNNIKHFPSGDKFIQEAWRGLNVWFVPWRPMKLLKIVEKELGSSRTSNWTDIRSCVEEIGIEVGDEILDKILEEIILELL